MNRAPRILGLMSGTSADGVDAVLLELPGFHALGEGGAQPPPIHGAIPRGRVVAHTYTPYPDDLRAVTLEAMRGTLEVRALTQLNFWLGEFYVSAVGELSRDADLIANHGQTVYHIPRVDEHQGWHRRATLQIGESSFLALHTNKPVISDFRPPDMVLGGQAAPLVSFADHVLFAEAGVKRAFHNLGGISNITYLPGLDSSSIVAFDTGPANCLIDEAMNRLGKRLDDDGRIADSGLEETRLTGLWLRDPYFQRPPPKSTGREYWTLEKLPGVFELQPKDIVSSVTAFSASSAADAYRRFVLPLGLTQIVVAGGGAHNPAFMRRFASLLPEVNVIRMEDSPLSEHGFTSATREGATFAVLGYYSYQGWRNTLPHTTGAARAVVAGKLTRP
jgi:anhydro-N-acetylmuramic acid kinase